MSTRHRGRTVLAVLLGVAIALPGVITAHDEHATGIYKVRHDEYTKLGDAFKTLRDQTRARKPDSAAIRNAAQVVKAASQNQYDWFPAGSGPRTGIKTRAKAEIWTRPQEFATAQKRFTQRADQLNAAAGSGDIAAVRTQFDEVGGACKGCHDTFRVPER
ncbi:MAG: cytochrome c [Gammaproteobacteria bacterium]|nr:cytochrome c [Gammaproteobacteria bacterium]